MYGIGQTNPQSCGGDDTESFLLSFSGTRRASPLAPGGVQQHDRRAFVREKKGVISGSRSKPDSRIELTLVSLEEEREMLPRSVAANDWLRPAFVSPFRPGTARGAEYAKRAQSQNQRKQDQPDADLAADAAMKHWWSLRTPSFKTDAQYARRGADHQERVISRRGQM